MRTDKPKLVSRNECRDIRELDKARASGYDGKRSEPPPIDDRQAARWRQPRRRADTCSALVHPRCPDEPLLEKGYVHDLEKYVKEHKRLFTMDHFYPYGPWSTDSPSWQHFLDALYKPSRETASMGTRISQRGTGPLIVYPSRHWAIRPQLSRRQGRH